MKTTMTQQQQQWVLTQEQLDIVQNTSYYAMRENLICDSV